MSGPRRLPRPTLPQSGDVVVLGREASVQFAGDRAVAARVIRVHDWYTYVGWCWLDAYVLDRAGVAIERRSLFVQVGGLRPAAAPRTRPPARATMIATRSADREGVADAVRQ